MLTAGRFVEAHEPAAVRLVTTLYNSVQRFWRVGLHARARHKQHDNYARFDILLSLSM